MNEHITEESLRLLLGLKVRQLRKDRKLSLSEVAKASGISVSYLNEIEKGKKYPKANKIATLARCLNVSYDWLISLQPHKDLAPITELIKSDLLSNLPLEIFGIEPADLIDIISGTPSKVSAFITTLMEMARNYDIRVENFYLSVLRSYQEMHENYFEDIEQEVKKFREQFPEFTQIPLKLEPLEQILSENYGYQIKRQSLNQYPELASLRSILLEKSGKPHLLINPALSEQQQIFTLCREIGYNYMKLKDRAYTSTWVKVESFEQLLNNFKASYFAGALIIPEEELVENIKDLMRQETWRSDKVQHILSQYDASPETLAHRITSIVPKFFGLKQLFFLRFHHRRSEKRFELNKELHLAGLYNPHASMIDEHYCQRWVSLNILKDLDHLQNDQSDHKPVIVQVQRSQYIDSENEYLCISLARPFSPTPNTNSSVTIGFLVNKAFKKQVKFWNADNVPIRAVGVTCERCSAKDCQERAAPAKIQDAISKSERIQNSLSQLQEDYLES